MILSWFLLGTLIGAVLTRGALDWWREYKSDRDERQHARYLTWLKAHRAESQRAARNAARASGAFVPLKYEPIKTRDSDEEWWC